MPIGRSDVTALLGPVDDELAAEIVATGASPEELAEAWAWVNNDEALVNDGRPLPGGRVAELIDMLETQPQEE